MRQVKNAMLVKKYETPEYRKGINKNGQDDWNSTFFDTQHMDLHHFFPALQAQLLYIVAQGAKFYGSAGAAVVS